MTAPNEPTPYEVDIADPATLGRIRYAAERGDKRAKLTLTKAAESGDGAGECKPDDQNDPPKSGTVTAGRAMFRSRGRPADYDAA